MRCCCVCRSERGGVHLHSQRQVAVLRHPHHRGHGAGPGGLRPAHVPHQGAGPGPAARPARAAARCPGARRARRRGVRWGHPPGAAPVACALKALLCWAQMQLKYCAVHSALPSEPVCMVVSPLLHLSWVACVCRCAASSARHGRFSMQCAPAAEDWPALHRASAERSGSACSC